MPIDASIYQNVGKFPSLNDFDEQANRLQQNKLALMTSQQQYAQGQQAMADQNALRTAAQGFGDDQTQNYRSILKTGNVKAAQDYLKSSLDNQKTQADTKLSGSHAANFDSEVVGRQLDQSIKAHDFHLQELGGITPDQVPKWINDGVQSGVFTAEQGQAGMARFQQAASQPGFDFNAWRQQGLQAGTTATEQLKMTQAKLIADNSNLTSRQNNNDTNRTHVQTTGMSNAVTMRGQNMTDARSKETNAAAMSKPFEVTGPDGQPLLVQQDKGGNITPVAGFGPKTGSTKPLTDSQAKALGFGTRMQESDKLIGSLASEGVKTPSLIKQSVEGIPVIGGALGMAANATVASPKQQQVEQAQRDFVNAVLRRESGAAISSSEFDNARKQYFPQPGDSAPVLAQKTANRKLASEGVMSEVPKGQRGSIGPQPAPGGLTVDHSAIDAELARRAGK